MDLTLNSNLDSFLHNIIQSAIEAFQQQVLPHYDSGQSEDEGSDNKKQTTNSEDRENAEETNRSSANNDNDGCTAANDNSLVGCTAANDNSLVGSTAANDNSLVGCTAANDNSLVGNLAANDNSLVDCTAANEDSHEKCASTNINSNFGFITPSYGNSTLVTDYNHPTTKITETESECTVDDKKGGRENDSDVGFNVDNDSYEHTGYHNDFLNESSQEMIISDDEQSDCSSIDSAQRYHNNYQNDQDSQMYKMQHSEHSQIKQPYIDSSYSNNPSEGSSEINDVEMHDDVNDNIDDEGRKEQNMDKTFTTDGRFNMNLQENLTEETNELSRASTQSSLHFSSSENVTRQFASTFSPENSVDEEDSDNNGLFIDIPDNIDLKTPKERPKTKDCEVPFKHWLSSLHFESPKPQSKEQCELNGNEDGVQNNEKGDRMTKGHTDYPITDISSMDQHRRNSEVKKRKSEKAHDLLPTISSRKRSYTLSSDDQPIDLTIEGKRSINSSKSALQGNSVEKPLDLSCHKIISDGPNKSFDEERNEKQDSGVQSNRQRENSHFEYIPSFMASCMTNTPAHLDTDLTSTVALSLVDSKKPKRQVHRPYCSKNEKVYKIPMPIVRKYQQRPFISHKYEIPSLQGLKCITDDSEYSQNSENSMFLGLAYDKKHNLKDEILKKDLNRAKSLSQMNKGLLSTSKILFKWDLQTLKFCNNEFVCGACSKDYENEEDVLNHISKAHLQVIPDNNINEATVCNYVQDSTTENVMISSQDGATKDPCLNLGNQEKKMKLEQVETQVRNHQDISKCTSDCQLETLDLRKNSTDINKNFINNQPTQQAEIQSFAKVVQPSGVFLRHINAVPTELSVLGDNNGKEPLTTLSDASQAAGLTSHLKRAIDEITLVLQRSSNVVLSNETEKKAEKNPINQEYTSMSFQPGTQQQLSSKQSCSESARILPYPENTTINSAHPVDLTKCGSSNLNKAKEELQEQKFKCRYCEKAFQKQFRARRHERMVHLKERPHACSVCKKAFAQTSDLRKHYISIHKMAICTVCHMMFEDEEKKQIHVKSEHKGMTCVICKAMFTTTVKLNLHMDKSHPEIEKEPVKTCRKKGLKIHGDIHGNEKPLTKEPTKMPYQNINDFNQISAVTKSCLLPSTVTSEEHTDKIQTDQNKDDPNTLHDIVIRHQCKTCDKNFKCGSDLRKHLIVHSDEMPKFSCLICDKHFKRLSNLKQHEKTFLHLKNKADYDEAEAI